MNLLYDVSLKPFNTFGVEATAQAFVRVSTLDALISALDHACAFDETLILGGGSNILCTRDIAGIVIHIGLKGIRVVEETETSVLVEAGAGELWDDLVRHTVEQNWCGIENLSLIPGTVGAAPVQNIGAYGAELQNALVSVQGLMRRTGEERTLTREECRFAYRDSIFKHELRDLFIVCSVRLRLQKNPPPERLKTSYGAIEQELAAIPAHKRTVRDVSEAVRRIRRSKLPDPAVIGNAGSFFKNPEVPKAVFERIASVVANVPSFAAQQTDYMKIPAGWLIEQCGWKGRRVGNAGIHAQQALVIVNYGGASGAEIAALAREVQASVEYRFGIRLETEVNIL
jgi:UDP-N-acetylmuramate dehydrogenase